MARWRLTALHYLNVEGVEWDYVEKDQQTQRNKRVHFAVPLHLNPNDSSDWNDKANEWIVVSDGSNPGPRDIIFKGPPTPDMEPLDAEAEAITNELRKKWDGAHPIESLPGQDYSQSLLSKFQAEVEAKLKETGGQYPQYSKGVDPAAFESLQQQVAELAKQNSQLIALLTQQMNKSVVVPERDYADEQRAEMAAADDRR